MGARPAVELAATDALAEAASWVSGYLETVSERPVLAQVEPGEIAARLPRR